MYTYINIYIYISLSLYIYIYIYISCTRVRPQTLRTGRGGRGAFWRTRVHEKATEWGGLGGVAPPPPCTIFLISTFGTKSDR